GGGGGRRGGGGGGGGGGGEGGGGPAAAADGGGGPGQLGAGGVDRPDAGRAGPFDVRRPGAAGPAGAAAAGRPGDADRGGAAGGLGPGRDLDGGQPGRDGLPGTGPATGAELAGAGRAADAAVRADRPVDRAAVRRLPALPHRDRPRRAARHANPGGGRRDGGGGGDGHDRLRHVRGARPRGRPDDALR